MARHSHDEHPRTVLNRLYQNEPPRKDAQRHAAWEDAVVRERTWLEAHGDEWPGVEAASR